MFALDSDPSSLVVTNVVAAPILNVVDRQYYWSSEDWNPFFPLVIIERADPNSHVGILEQVDLSQKSNGEIFRGGYRVILEDLSGCEIDPDQIAR
jgi:hypothetical protein